MTAESPDELYGLPLDRFVPARAALVKALRGEKRREEASEVCALRKPSVAAWAVNQLVRTQAKGLQALFEAGDDLARAQAQATAGKGGADAMRDATRRQRDAMSVLLQAAEGLLSSEGQALSSATMERVSETLRAAAVDQQARGQVVGGCLTQELRFIGVGIGGSAPPSAKRARGARADPAKGKARARDTEEAQAQAEREVARERTAALKAARRAEAEARRAATRADKELAAARVRQEAAAASLDEAQTLLLAAARRADDAAAKLTAAERALRDVDQPRDTAP